MEFEYVRHTLDEDLKDQLQALIQAISSIASGDVHGPDGLEGVAMALAGKAGAGVTSVHDAIQEVAEAVLDLSNSVREIAEAIRDRP